MLDEEPGLKALQPEFLRGTLERGISHRFRAATGPEDRTGRRPHD
jgi:hypothetical protein